MARGNKGVVPYTRGGSFFWYLIFGLILTIGLFALFAIGLWQIDNQQHGTCNNCVNGTTPNISVGETTTGDPLTNASVINIGTLQNVILDFTIPRGEDGNCTGQCKNGTDGKDGINGTSPTVEVGETITGPPDSNASVINVGTEEDVILDFTIPRGKDGINGTCIPCKNGTDGINGTCIPCTNGTNGINGTNGQNGIINVTIITTNLTNSSQSIQIYNTTEFNIIFNITENSTFISTPGPPGPPGNSSNITVGNTTTGDPGTNASVVNIGTNQNVILDFTIPRGNPGENGTCTVPCINGTSPTVEVGETSTGPPGSNASVINIGTDENVILDFTIPRGDPGINGTSTSVSVGNTTTGSPGTQASVINAGTTQNVILNFTIPQGEPGINGTSSTIIIGNTTTGSPGTNASVINAGTPENAILNFTIPEGEPGINGKDGQNASINVTIINNSNFTNVTEIIYNTTQFDIFINITENATFISTPGPQGPPGQNGTAATITIGNTTTGNPGTQANVVNAGTSQNAILNFTIPQGQPGINGTSTSVSVGNTTTGAPGTQSSVVNAGTTQNVILNFTIPQGQSGINGTSTSVSVGNTTTGVAGTQASVVNAGTTQNVILNFTIPQGQSGINGTSTSVSVGNTTTGSAGTQANVVNAGTTQNVILNFTIPKGDTGSSGTNGTSTSVSVGNTTTGAAGTQASVVNAGTSQNVILNFTIPKGDTGASGTNGTNGSNGTNAGTTILYFTNVTTSGSVSTTAYKTLSQLTITSNGTFYFQWEGIVSQTVGNGAIRYRISQPAGTEIDNSLRIMGDSLDTSLITTAISVVTTAPVIYLLEWSVSSSGTTYTVAKNSFRSWALGVGAVS